MSQPKADEAQLVRAAQRGNQRARDELVRIYLPLVYNIVGRSLDGYPDIDDVVQETMLRMVRDLSEVRNPEGFRPWVGVIAVRQVSTYLRQAAEAAQFAAALSTPPEPTADLDGAAVLQLRLYGQRREVAEAARWLDAEDRAVLSLWWLVAVGEMTGGEVAVALETTTAYAAVRVRRMRSQLDLSRSVVAALAASPCRQLDLATTQWDSRPSALWRKRIYWHVRDCSLCLAASRERIAAEQLLAGLGLVAVPALLAARVTGTTAADGARAANGGRVSRAIRGHPAVAATAVVMVGALVAACALVLPGRQSQAAQTSTVVPVRSAPTSTAAAGPAIPTNTPRARARPRARPTPHRTPTARPPAPVAANPVSAQVGCSSHNADTWANWPMPNSPGSGLPHPASYTDLGNGTVRDNVTCLSWQREPAPGTYTFTQAKAYCAGLTLAGGDWQLPTRIQLMSIVNTAQAGPAIDTTAFPDTPAAFFWTSSPWFVKASPRRAWIFNFYEGMESNDGFETGSYKVRCVRSPDGTGVPGYQISGGQVTDPATGLTWQRSFSATQMTAAAATSYCAGLDLDGHSWRLPSVKELATLVDEDRVSPALDVSAFPGVPPDVWFWSSTVSAPSPPERWGLNYNDGFSYFRSTSDTGYARCVS